MWTETVEEDLKKKHAGYKKLEEEKQWIDKCGHAT
jgi:hypothetical protein